jgi:hypothetical protein
VRKVLLGQDAHLFDQAASETKASEALEAALGGMLDRSEVRRHAMVAGSQ